ncbi:hypothetical protein CTAYLR_003689 [Chrysophaeum taylorii]|uniref:Tudor domain-containing protein n=1 Tax=Chrysophaeum taylorii TaxID=2483200 RepID=A0AAD7UNN9_9STRA|nr:hypothetical protein CTAYLR_003689 [Chrysophaeum taylorii]
MTKKHLAPGCAVQVRYSTTPEFYPGKVEAVENERYAIAYDDGDRETGVVRRRIRLPGQKQKFVLRQGAEVDARYGKKEDVLPGRVVAVNDDGSYDVAFDQGEVVVEGLERKFIFADFTDPTLPEGTRVECRYADTPKFYPGVVKAIADDGSSYSIIYDDGDEEADVVPRRIRLAGQKQRRLLRVGEAVDARSDSGKVRPGTVTHAATRVLELDNKSHEETLYAVSFDHGEVVTDLERKYIFAEFFSDDDDDDDEAPEAPSNAQPITLPTFLGEPTPAAPRNAIDARLSGSIALDDDDRRERPIDNPGFEAPASPPIKRRYQSAIDVENSLLIIGGGGDIESSGNRASAKPALRPAGVRGCGLAAGVAFTPCGRIVAAATRSRIALWLARKGHHIGNLSGHTGRVLALKCERLADDSASPKPPRTPTILVSGGSDGMACVWRLPCETRRSKTVDDDVSDEDETVEAAWTSFSQRMARKSRAKSRNVAAGSLWDLMQPVAIHRHPHGSWVLGVDVSRRNLLATAASDGVVRIWKPLDSDDDAMVIALDGHHWYATAVAFAPGAELLASGSMDRTLRVWSYAATSSSANEQLVVESGTGASEDLSSIDRLSALGREVPIQQVPCIVLSHAEPIYSVAWTPDGTRLVAGSNGGSPHVWNYHRGAFDEHFEPTGEGHVGPVVACATISGTIATVWRIRLRISLSLNLVRAAAKAAGEIDGCRVEEILARFIDSSNNNEGASSKSADDIEMLVARSHARIDERSDIARQRTVSQSWTLQLGACEKDPMPESIVDMLEAKRFDCDDLKWTASSKGKNSILLRADCSEDAPIEWLEEVLVQVLETSGLVANVNRNVTMTRSWNVQLVDRNVTDEEFMNIVSKVDLDEDVDFCLDRREPGAILVLTVTVRVAYASIAFLDWLEEQLIDLCSQHLDKVKSLDRRRPHGHRTDHAMPSAKSPPPPPLTTRAAKREWILKPTTTDVSPEKILDLIGKAPLIDDDVTFSIEREGTSFVLCATTGPGVPMDYLEEALFYFFEETHTEVLKSIDRRREAPEPRSQEVSRTWLLTPIDDQVSAAQIQSMLDRAELDDSVTFTVRDRPVDNRVRRLELHAEERSRAAFVPFDWLEEQLLDFFENSPVIMRLTKASY